MSLPPDDGWTPEGEDEYPRLHVVDDSHLHVVDDSEEAWPDWARALAVTTRGKGRVPTKDPGNAALILTQTQAWKGCLIHDVVTDQILVRKPPPLPNLPDDWPSLAPPSAEVLCDDHADYIGLWLRRMWHQSWSDGAVRRAIVYAAHHNPIDPLRDYLDACADGWDQKFRCDTWLSDYLGAPRASLVNMRIGPMWLISAVARAYAPGAKVDHVMVLEGDQGRGKNKALEILFGDDHYLPELPDVRDKDAMHLLAGAWCACIDELSATKAADVERVKSFLSRRIDIYRPPYGRDVVRRPRRTVFAATTNAPAYLTDPSGNRRYWPVQCGEIDHAALAKDRDQIWGEAVSRYREGELWYPDTADERRLLGEAQTTREQVDEWDHKVLRIAHGKEWVTVGYCLAELGLELKDWRPVDQHRVSRALQRAGWRHARCAVRGRYFVAPEGES